MNKRIMQALALALLAVLLLAALAIVGIALAQGSGAAIGWQVLSGGGAPSSGGNVTLNDTLGQPVIGPSSGGGNVALGAGYWYGLGYDETKCSLAADHTYYYNQTWPVSVAIQTKGTLDCLRVRRYDQNHANRTGTSVTNGVGWGRYWTLTGTDSLGQPASGYNLTLTLPHNDLSAPKVCKYPGDLGGSGWDCDDGSHTTFTASTVTRSGLTSLSDWAVGNNVGPTAVTLRDFSARTGKDLAGLAVLALVAGGLALAWRLRQRRA